MDDIARETLAASPKYLVGQPVQYRDREGRIQVGRVKWIEAKWHGWGDGPVEPLVIYSLTHPTYRNRTFYTADKEILRALSERELEGYRYE